ncbi:MAG TPA: hypothetical protein GXZ90_05165 [Clostridiales bacterium]|nr:hypothetical protein [Clostridiales bacterium]
MNLSFREFSRFMLLVALPTVLYYLVYASLIASIPDKIISLIIFAITVIPIMYFGIKIVAKLADLIDK